MTAQQEIDYKEMEQQKELARLIERFSGVDGVHATAIPALHFIRTSHATDPISTLHEPALCIVAQGTKLVMLGQESYYYDPSHYLVVSVDLPISGQILEATPDSPYLCLRLDIQPEQIYGIMSDTGHALGAERQTQRGLFVSRTNNFLLDAVLRLVRLLDSPRDIGILAPLVIREILYRIMIGEQGDAVKQIAVTGSHAQRIAQVIQCIKRDFAEPLRIEHLASIANMSSSSLHCHFKEVTAMSPLQYQKQLRLQEARRLLLTEAVDAANAGFQVGYESPSQFSREYSRMFGLPPLSDIKRLRSTGV